MTIPGIHQYRAVTSPVRGAAAEARGLKRADSDNEARRTCHTMKPEKRTPVEKVAAEPYDFSLFLAGLMANRILFAGARLPEFKVELIGFVAVMVLVTLGPLLVFSPALERGRTRLT